MNPSEDVYKIMVMRWVQNHSSTTPSCNGLDCKTLTLLNLTQDGGAAQLQSADKAS